MNPKDRKRQTIVSISFKRDDEDLLDRFDEMKRKEGIEFSKLVRKAMTEYLTNHAEGNPAYTIDQFQDQHFKAMPAFMSDRKKWMRFFMNDCTELELEEIRAQIISIDRTFTDALTTKRRFPNR